MRIKEQEIRLTLHEHDEYDDDDDDDDDISKELSFNNQTQFCIYNPLNNYVRLLLKYFCRDRQQE